MNTENKKNCIENKQTHYDVIIIGGGPAGYAAALYCSRAGLETLVMEQNFAGGQMSTTDHVENYPGIEPIMGLDLAVKMEAGAHRFGAVSQRLIARSIQLESTPKQIETDQGTYTCDALILAMGAGPRKLELDGEDELTGRGISYCATCDGALFRGQTVAVTGGGNSAVTEALSLAALCGHVYLICRRETLKAEQHLIQQLTERENLTLMTNTEIEQLHAGEINGFTRLSALTLKDRKTGQRTQLPVGGLFVAIGRRPSTDLVRGHLELTEEGYVQTDETTKTSLPGVFAAGDLRTKPLRQIITAASDGAVAAVMAEQYLRTAR